MIFNLLRISGVLVLPIGCIYFADYLDASARTLLADKTINVLCLLDLLMAERELSCLAADWVDPLRIAAWVALALGVLPVVLFLGAAMICGTSRWMNAAVFRRLIPVAIGLVSANMVV